MQWMDYNSHLPMLLCVRRQRKLGIKLSLRKREGLGKVFED